MKTVRRPARPAFTLVELLVVMAIIGLLAAILIPTVNIVRIRGKNARIALEINQLVAAMEGYKQKYGDYPPDFSNRVVVQRHLGKAFPRMSSQEAQIFWAAVWDTNANRSRVDPAEALYFWLGGLSANVKEPFSGEGGPIRVLRDGNGNITGFAANPSRNAPQYEFDEKRLTQQLDTSTGVLMSTDEEQLGGLAASSNDPFPVYLPPYLKKTPYVYFDSRTYIHNPVNTVYVNGQPTTPPPPRYPPAAFGTSSVGVARPYRTDTPRSPSPGAYDQVPFEWANAKTYQIICAGLDEDFGADTIVNRNRVDKLYPSGENYSVDPAADEDNLCNFSEGRTLGDSRP